MGARPPWRDFLDHATEVGGFVAMAVNAHVKQRRYVVPRQPLFSSLIEADALDSAAVHLNSQRPSAGRIEHGFDELFFSHDSPSQNEDSTESTPGTALTEFQQCLASLTNPVKEAA